MKNGLVIFLTIVYSMFWFALLFIVVGFFMIKPVAFYNKLRGNRYKSTYNKHSSKYGYSDDQVEDETMFIDDMDED